MMAAASRITLAQELRRRWWAYLLMLAVWVLVWFRIFTNTLPQFPILYNNTPSLPYSFMLVKYGTPAPARGDFIVYKYGGGNHPTLGKLKGHPLFKRVEGLPGDRITVRGRTVFVNGKRIGDAAAYAGKIVLDPIEPGVIPPGHYFVMGTMAQSFDSRYRQSGLVRTEQIITEVLPLF